RHAVRRRRCGAGTAGAHRAHDFRSADAAQPHVGRRLRPSVQQDVVGAPERDRSAGQPRADRRSDHVGGVAGAAALEQRALALSRARGERSFLAPADRGLQHHLYAIGDERRPERAQQLLRRRAVARRRRERVRAVDWLARLQRAERVPAHRRPGEPRVAGVRIVLQLGVPTVPPSGALRAVAMRLAAAAVLALLACAAVQSSETPVAARLTDLERAIAADLENLALAADYRQLTIAAGQFDRSIDFLDKLAKRKGSGPNVRVSLALAYVDKVPTAGDVRRLYLGRDAMNALTASIAQRPCVLAYYMRGLINLYYNRFIFHRADKG